MSKGKEKQVRNTDLELKDKLVAIKRVTKVTKGGRTFSFAAIVVVGDEKGIVGHGLGKAGDVATHETYFAPFTDPKEKVNRAKNWIEWKDFEKAISEVNKIYFTFKIETYGGKLDKASCMVEIDKGFREYCKKRGYYFALCN